MNVTYLLTIFLFLIVSCDSSSIDSGLSDDPYKLSPWPFRIKGNYEESIDSIKFNKFLKNSNFDSLLTSKLVEPISVNYNLKNNITWIKISEIDYHYDFEVVLFLKDDQESIHRFSQIEITPNRGNDFNYYLVSSYYYNDSLYEDSACDFEIR